jgi:hypothetical protein
MATLKGGCEGIAVVVVVVIVGELQSVQSICRSPCCDSMACLLVLLYARHWLMCLVIGLRAGQGGYTRRIDF